MAETGGGGDDGRVQAWAAPSILDPLRYSTGAYRSPHGISVINWSVRLDKWYRIAVGSKVPGYCNFVQIMFFEEFQWRIHLYPLFSIDHPYAPSKIMFLPNAHTDRQDLLATSSDCLRIWGIGDDSVGVIGQREFNNHCGVAPPDHLTSFDWNEIDICRIVTSSKDNSCTVWDIVHGAAQPYSTHASAVTDVSWRDAQNFVSASVDGTIRFFDMRTGRTGVHYPTRDPPGWPIVRVECNKIDPNYVAAVVMRSSNVLALDIRYLQSSIWQLCHHRGPVNAIAWSPANPRIIGACSEDCRVSLLDVSSSRVVAERGGDQPGSSSAAAAGGSAPEALMSFDAGYSIRQLSWSVSHPRWLAISSSTDLEIVGVRPSDLFRTSPEQMRQVAGWR